jgi:hypothetical protein
VSDDDEPRADDLSDELAKKYDPERLLKLVSTRAGRGDPLDHSLRAKYETRFGVDLSHVRIITGAFAEEFNRKRDAYAVTVGGTGMILMGNSPEKSMGSAAGQALLAHELTHVAQATRGLHRSGVFDHAMEFTPEDEEEAHEVEHEVHDEHFDSGKAAAQRAQKKQKAEEKRKEDIEKVKKRVMDMFGEAARNQHGRNGGRG